jgi:hypothetical protein
MQIKNELGLIKVMDIIEISEIRSELEFETVEEYKVYTETQKNFVKEVNQAIGENLQKVAEIVSAVLGEPVATPVSTGKVNDLFGDLLQSMKMTDNNSSDIGFKPVTDELSGLKKVHLEDNTKEAGGDEYYPKQ